MVPKRGLTHGRPRMRPRPLRPSLSGATRWALASRSRIPLAPPPSCSVHDKAVAEKRRTRMRRRSRTLGEADVFDELMKKPLLKSRETGRGQTRPHYWGSFMSAQGISFLRRAAVEDGITWFSVHHRVIYTDAAGSRRSPVMRIRRSAPPSRTPTTGPTVATVCTLHRACSAMSVPNGRACRTRAAIRQEPNLVACKNLYMDLDVKPGAYASELPRIALIALKAFLQGGRAAVSNYHRWQRHGRVARVLDAQHRVRAERVQAHGGAACGGGHAARADVRQAVYVRCASIIANTGDMEFQGRAGCGWQAGRSHALRPARR